MERKSLPNVSLPYHCGPSPSYSFRQNETRKLSLKTARDPLRSWGFFPRCCDGVLGFCPRGPGWPCLSLLMSMLDVWDEFRSWPAPPSPLLSYHEVLEL